jgi:ribonuclease III
MTEAPRFKKGVGVHTHRTDLETLEERLGYVFSKKRLLEQALTHRSYVNETDEKLEDNQRLEFLGDAILGMATADALFHRDERAQEGALSNRQSQLVCEPTLAQIAERLEIGQFLRLGKGETRTGGRQKNGLLADALEAIFAAIYLDAGPEQGAVVARTVIVDLMTHAFEELVDAVEGNVQATDHKSMLQRRLQTEHGERPRYVLVEEHGPPHERTFAVDVFCGGRLLGRGWGSSKKRAEQVAAAQALQSLDRSNPSTPRGDEPDLDVGGS